MRTKIVYVLNILIIIGMAAIIVWQLAFAEERDTRLITRAVTLLVVFLLSVLGIKRKRSPFDYKIYEERYGYIIKTAFSHDKINYMKLMTVITYYNENKFDKAIKMLEKLEEKCAESDDYSAVLYFRALCKDESGNKTGAIADYEDLLTRDYTNSHAWSNLGLIYVSIGKTDEALRCYREAVSHDPSNQYAHCNLGNLYLQKGDYNFALEHALKSLEAEPKIKQSMSLAAICYGRLGDSENAEKYCKMYGKYGGDAKELHKLI
ncbi:MAG: tetratricopeptide repeat protein [Oscillospiraceae bacterium]|nr:tetratricopeptide repeat protein [Oscillospiraceae bacterium]